MLGDPVERLQVTQAALSLFHIGFNDVARIALLGVAAIALCQLVGNELRVIAFNGLLAKFGFGFSGELLIAEKKTRIEQGALDRHILFGQSNAFFGRPEGVTDLYADIPEGVEHVFDDALCMGRCLVRPDKQQVDIAGWREDVSAIPTGREHGEALTLCGVAGAVHMNGDVVVERVQRLIHDSREEPGCIETACALLQAFLRDHPAPEEGAVKVVEHLFARLGLIGQVV